MADETPQWRVWLDQLVRVHAALDKVGSSIYPADNVDDYVKALLYEILVIHSKIDSLEDTVESIEETDKTILKIFKTAAASMKDYSNVDLFDQFDEKVRNHYKGFLENTEHFLPKHSTWSSEPGKIATTASLGIGYGKKDGIYVEWYEDGKVKTIGMFDDDEPVGVWAAFNKKGKMLTRYDHGKSQSQLAEEFKKNTSLAESKEEESGLGAVILGSLAAMTLSSVFGAIKKRKKALKMKEVESVEEVESIKA